MPKKLIAIVAVMVSLLSGAAFLGAWPAAKTGDCCHEGSLCCDPPQGCCQSVSAVAKTEAGCCEPGADCCYPGSPCCGDCCSEGSACCDSPQACCFTDPAVAKAPQGKGCCMKPAKTDACCVAAKGDKADQAADKKSAVTVIAVEDMECPTCAKKIVARLTEVAGVAKAEADVKTSKLTVAAKDGATPSPKAMWEAVEKAGFKPTKLEGPGGNFTEKPKE